MRRLYFLTPGAESTVAIANELADLGLKRNEVHVVGHDHAQLHEMGVNRATLLQTSDVVNASKRGLFIGVPVGVLLGLIALFFLPIELGVLGLVLLLVGSGLFGGFFGVWASTMVGVSVPDVKIAKHEKDIERGAFVMLVDVPPAREGEITEIIKRHHPEVTIEVVTPQERKSEAGGQGA